MPCFFRQALAAARASTEDETVHRRVLDAVGEVLPQLPLTASPPEAGQEVYRVVAEVTGVSDPYREAKKESNHAALALYPYVKAEISKSEDPLLTACKLAIAANAMDLGAQAEYEKPEEVVDKALSLPFGVLQYDSFRKSLEGASSLLFLADNAGEIVFDRVLIEQILESYDPEIHFVVRGAPIINDATWEDAEEVGIDKIAPVVSNGYGAPATILSQCSSEMLDLYQSADMIISKGQGNYESLSDRQDPLFFLFKVKCQVAARLVGAKVGDAILKAQGA